MTRHQAIRELIAGKKIKHTSFGSGEYVYMKGRIIMSEDGYNFNKWWYTTGKELGQKGWAVYEDYKG